ncbi:MAG TPA: hypothetical protein VK179_14095 [Bacteroidales bacterium]|nr:hypothetical protein [Bacteroidales bacterium]
MRLDLLNKEELPGNMIKKIFLILVFLIGLKSYAQSDRNQFLGLNILQLPASTINFNYSIELKPFLTTIADLGYAFGYHDEYDVIGYILTRHIDLYDGYSLEKQSGGYIKIGGYYNLRSVFEKQNYFHLGLFITNSIVHEKGLFMSLNDSRPYSYAQEIEHTVYLPGLNASLGYELKIANRLKTSVDFQLSTPTDRYLKLYSYSNFIPGMGYKGSLDRWFPMLILNLKYRL